MIAGKPQSAPADLRDPTTVAVEVATVKGEVALLAQQVSSSLGNVSSQLSALQGEVRDQGRILRSVETSQHDMQSHSQGLERLARAIDGNSLEFSRWREEHEAKNQAVSDRVTTFKGALIGFGLLGTVVTTLALLWVNAEFANVRREGNSRMDGHIATGQDQKQTIERRIDRIEAEVEKVKTTRNAR